MITGNKGEWSEIYALFKLLGEGKVHAGDAAMNKLDLYYPIINVIRQESKRYEYKPNKDKNIVVVTEDGVVLTTLSMNRFLEESNYLLAAIRRGGDSAQNRTQSHQKDSAFSVCMTEKFMQSIACTKLKASSNDKADIHIVIHDLRTNMTPTLGFSIKSQLGHASTLLNAGKPTNLQFKVAGMNTNKEAEAINSIPNHIDRINRIYQMGYSLEFYDVKHKTFKNNLLFIDSCLPKLLGLCLIEDSTTDNSDVKSIVYSISEQNPFKYEGNNVHIFYENKIKQLLIASALGMYPSIEWNGRYDANGGYLVVRKDGEIVCYHFYNKNDVEDYLFNNTRFERASRSRYEYGSIYEENGQFFLDLNLQIRFKK